MASKTFASSKSSNQLKPQIIQHRPQIMIMKESSIHVAKDLKIVLMKEGKKQLLCIYSPKLMEPSFINFMLKLLNLPLE